MALKSRAEMQLLDSLKRKNAHLTSLIVKAEPDQVETRPEFQRLQASSEEERMISEVRQLKDKYYFSVITDNQCHSISENASQIELNDARRRDRHMGARMEYEEDVKAISEDVESAIIREADDVKKVVAQLDVRINESLVALSKNTMLLSLTKANISALWNKLEDVCQQRTDAIAHFAAQLKDVERSRMHRVRITLQRLTCVLMEIAYALPFEVERIIESEACEVNAVMISNCRVYADLVARMDTANVDVFLKARLAWEQAQYFWRRLRHQDAIATFQTMLSSPRFTDPDERQHVLQQIRVFQDKIHSEQRLKVLEHLSGAGATFSVAEAKQNLEELNRTRELEEETNRSFVIALRDVDRSTASAANVLREKLRFDLHEYSAMAKEGAIEEANAALVTLLRDDAAKELFGVAGGWKPRLEFVAQHLCVADVIYCDNLAPIMSSVDLVLSAIPLKGLMENQGKEADYKAVQLMLEKIRKATKSDIMALLPGLQTQMSMLLKLEEMGDSFKSELKDIAAQLDAILMEFGPPHDIDPAASAPLTMLGRSTLTLNSTTCDASQENGPTVDFLAIRKVQRRLGTLLYASELKTSWHQTLRFIYDQLLLQNSANRIVDDVITRECDDLIETRQQESRFVVDELEKRLIMQSTQLNNHVKNLANFFLQVVVCLEESVNRVQHVNLSVMDLLDALTEDNESALQNLETELMLCCARLRHSPNDNVLRDEFQRALDMLNQIERKYRTYAKQKSLAADNHVIVLTKQRLLYRQRLCNFFEMKHATQSELDELLVPDMLSMKYILEQVSDLSNTVKESAANESSAESSSATDRASDSDVTVALSLSDLAQCILQKCDDEGAADQLVDTEDKPFRDQNDIIGAEITPVAVPLKSQLPQQTAYNKVQKEFLVLSISNGTVASVLAAFRDALLSKYDSDASITSIQTGKLCAERQTNSAILLEERLRVHWPRKGRLDVECYQPRMSELLTHQKRLERHLRGLCSKFDKQQVAFAKKVEEVYAHVEQIYSVHSSFHAQLPLQLSLAALLSLKAKAKKHFCMSKSTTMESLKVLEAVTTSDMNSLLSFCQEFIRTCSLQLFPDLTSHEVISECNYHPEEIIAIKEKLAAFEVQARDRMMEREKQVAQIRSKQDQLLNLWEVFLANVQSSEQSLAVKEGLGQTFSHPRRIAQESLRLVIMRYETRSATISELLRSLQSIVAKELSSDYLNERKSTSQVVRILMQLRAKLYHFGMYFSFLRYPSQLEPKPVEYHPVTGREENESHGENAVIRDNEVVAEEDRMVAVSFLDFVDQVCDKCQEDAQALFKQDGNQEDFRLSNESVALVEYLSTLKEKARAFLLLQEVTYRDQVKLFAHLLTLVPEFVMTNLAKQAKQKIQQKISELNSMLESQYDSWMNLKNRHMVELGPHLFSSNNLNLLHELETREKSRSMSIQVALRKTRVQFLSGQIQMSLEFEAQLVGLCQSLLLLLDSSVLSPTDLKPSLSGHTSEHKRKSLKRLRKLARVNEIGDPREVKRSATELHQLASRGEAPRFPLRFWSRIPSFGLHLYWADVKAKILADDLTEQSDPSIQDLTCVPLTSSDGACVSLLTPAHRALIKARDSAYLDYVNFCHHETSCFVDNLQERLHDEVSWTLSWEKDIAKINQSR